MAQEPQRQQIDHSQLQDSSIQQTQAGRDAVSFQNSQQNQVKINIMLGLPERAQPAEVDWDWALNLLQQKQLPEIRKRLSDTLGRERILMDIELQESLPWVGRSPLEAERRLEVQGADHGPLGFGQLLIEVFGRDDIAGKLLILGAPGAGKTTALLSLAEQLVCGALSQPKTIIPVLLELSTWRDDNQRLEDWLVEQLYDLHGGNRKHQLYEQWLERQVLLPLLDGLDELGLERQRKCTEKLNEFARQYPQLVVCSRLKEFETVKLKLNHLHGAVTLQPLADEQIESYWCSMGHAELWSRLQSSVTLQKLLEETEEGEPGLLRVPLFVTLAARAYNPQQPFQTKAELLQQYVDRQLLPDVRQSDRRKELQQRQWAYQTWEQEPDWRQIQRPLSWVARQLQQHNRVELLIEHIQPTWLETRKLQHYYQLLVGLIVGLIFGLIVGPIFGLSLGPIMGLIAGSVFGLIAGLSLGLILGQQDIALVEAFKLSMSQKLRLAILSSLKLGLSMGLRGGLVVGLSSGLRIGLGLRGGLSVGLSVGLSGWLINGLIFGLIWGLIVGSIVGLKQELKLRSHPNQGIWNSLQSLGWTTGLSFPLGFMFIFGTTKLPMIIADHMMQGGGAGEISEALWIALPQFVAPGMFGALLFGFSVGGGVPCIQHLCLRFVLWQSGIAPWNLARFLQYCTERKLLQQVGGRYRFLHRELLEHFAHVTPLR
jgi:hypothetical protein